MCKCEVVSSSIIIFHLSKLWKAKFLYCVVLCRISGEATGEIWNWSLLGMIMITAVGWSMTIWLQKYVLVPTNSIPAYT